MRDINIIFYYQVYIYKYDKAFMISDKRIMIWGIIIINIINIVLIILLLCTYITTINYNYK